MCARRSVDLATIPVTEIVVVTTTTILTVVVIVVQVDVVTVIEAEMVEQWQ
jgi:hypothetical protein